MLSRYKQQMPPLTLPAHFLPAFFYFPVVPTSQANIFLMHLYVPTMFGMVQGPSPHSVNVCGIELRCKHLHHTFILGHNGMFYTLEVQAVFLVPPLWWAVSRGEGSSAGPAPPYSRCQIPFLLRGPLGTLANPAESSSPFATN